MKLEESFSFRSRPRPPFDFELTVRKPAGWRLFNSYEIYEEQTLWSAARIGTTLAGLRLRPTGTVGSPSLSATVFTKEALSIKERGLLKQRIEMLIGVDDDLAPFYSFARRDPVLKLVVQDLYGMHDTESASLFDSVVLSICLQMARWERSVQMMDAIDRKYGDSVEFDGKRMTVRPSPRRIAYLDSVKFAKECKLGYRAKYLIGAAKMILKGFPDIHEIASMDPRLAKELLMELPGIGDYSADIINPHGGFPIDAWSVDIFGMLFFGKEPKNRRQAIEDVKREGMRRWGRWSWMAFFYVAQDLENLSRRLGIKLRTV